MLARVDGQAESRGTVRSRAAAASVTRSMTDFQRRRVGSEARGAERGVGRDRPGDEARRRRRDPAPAGEDRVAAVVARELADLPLTRQQPQRIRTGAAEPTVRSPRRGCGSRREKVVIDAIYSSAQRVGVGRRDVALGVERQHGRRQELADEIDVVGIERPTRAPGRASRAAPG